MSWNRTRALVVSLLALATMAGCKQDPLIIQPPSFSRPQALAFACLHVNATVEEPNAPATLQNLVECDPDNPPSATTPDYEATKDLLFALLTQTATGEVAAINLQGDGSVFDASSAVPGFTFIRVGEVPMGLVVPPETPGATYVANYASRSIQVIPTTWTVANEIEYSGTAPTPANVNLNGGPTDLALDPTGHFLFAPMPNVGMIIQLEIDDDGNFVEDAMGNPRVIEIPLSTASVLPIDPPLATDVDDAFLCPADYPLRPANTVAAAPITLGPTPEPVRIHVLEDRILIADSSQPVIHSFDLGAYGIFADSTAATPLNPQQIATSVPTLDVVATPMVPSTAGGSTADARFLYAIDAMDLSVMAIDYSDPADPGSWVVVPTNVGPQAEDRIRFNSFGGARALQILTPDYDPAEDLSGQRCPNDDDDAVDNLAPVFLRGVFLSVAMTDGTIRIVDVEDLNADCRGFGCSGQAEGNDEEVFIQRHRPRVGAYLRGSIELESTPSLSFNTSPGRLGNDGLPTSGSGPRLVALDFDAPTVCPAITDDAYFPAESGPQGAYSYDCRAYMKPIFGEDVAPLICAQSDPWAFEGQTWLGNWDGFIPNTNGGRGRVQQPSPNVGIFSDPFASFCLDGVLGGDDVTASGLGPDDPELGYQGDQLVIIGEPSAETLREVEGCDEFVIPDVTTEERDPIAFRITAATPTTLTLAGPRSIGGQYTLKEVVDCYPDPFNYQVNTLDVYSVVGSSAGFRHRVVDSGGSCRVDTAQAVDVCDTQSYRNARAFIGRPFISPELVFEICFDPDAVGDCENLLAEGSTSQLFIEVGDAPPQLFIDGGTQPVTLDYNAIDGQLYSVDVDSLGLVVMDLDPLNTVQRIR